ncbi:helix-turn-helix domain-containing protein [Amylibacter sp. IMCC11727]|uniref:GlxA family transcriptional regulator n=1 Tax=Amylibacter sp. IMCC11727 TaxID=3039851 RepID=UPI00244E5A7E|nr:helix-turn-helix domain-containing protein [Amylibacter sp. IMCC11727]WGI21786.1 helix-turn-helix domain-containing protein [Amylibacter sp. IMCC11727]
MPIWKKSETGTVRVGVLLFDQFSNHCLANAVEPLRAANDLTGSSVFEWAFLSMDGAPVKSSSGMEIAASGRLFQHSGDLLFVMPSYGYRAHSDTLSWAGLRMAAQRYGAIVGFDTGAWLMAAAGLLDQRRATIHWEELDAFAEAFPDVDVVRERHVMDGDRITCTGGMAAFDLVVELIADLKGEALRQDVRTLFMSGGRDGVAPKDRPVAQAISVMQAHLETPLAIADLARHVGLSQKALEGRMKAALGATPRQVYRRQRMVLARKLVLETTLSVAEISVRCGYQDATALTRAFQVEFGTSPRALRG